MNNNIEENKKEEQKNKRAYLFSLVGVLTLVVAIVGTTYAFFQLTATNNNINGSAATVGLDLQITKTAPATGTQIDGMVPLKGESIQEVVSNGCYDENNISCQLYLIRLLNTGSTDVTVSGTISFSGIEQMPNLKWQVASVEEDFTAPGIDASTSATQIGSPITVPTGSIAKELYLAVWIEETGTLQHDTGTFTATVTYETADGQGVTSTITE